MDATRGDGPVPVAVENPEHVEQLVRTAGDLADGILSAVEETDPAALVVGWHGRSRRTDALLGTTVDRLVERARCDPYIERIGREADGVDSVLLPVADGPHVRVAATAARAIAERNGARVHVLSVETPGSTAAGTGTGTGGSEYVAEARGLLEAGADAAGVSQGGTVEARTVPVETEVVEAEDVTDALVTAAADHDVVVLGATRQGPLIRSCVTMYRRSTRMGRRSSVKDYARPYQATARRVGPQAGRRPDGRDGYPRAGRERGGGTARPARGTTATVTGPPVAAAVAGLGFWALVVLATLTGLVTAWALGANSNSPPFAPAIGANAISTMRAAFLIGILAALGALMQGGSISETVGEGLIDGVAITSLAATAGPRTATGFMAFGVYTGYPVPAAFATTGAMIGVGLSLGV